MPPKKADAPKKKKATVDDKTFGMKNKKGGAVKKQIQQLQTQALSNKPLDAKKKEAERVKREAEKKAAEDAKRETADLFKPVQVQKVPFGVDPKTVLCVFHKKGGCEKGRKCKFSHDLNIERKAAKKDLYTDSREVDKDEEKKADTIDTWDEEKLRSVVLSKHGNPQTTTDKVCKYFIDAVENQKYGWFWTCPNGGNKCMYKHSLPPGFILKTKEQKAAEKALMDKSPLATLTLEDWLETERTKLTGTLTPVTEESFAKWKKERLDKKAAEIEAQNAKEATGRSMFEAGDWRDEDSSAEESDGDDDDTWNLDALRNETEKLREEKEEERLAKINGTEVPSSNDAVVAQEAAG
ncbi:Translation machinery-associated protein 46 [Penicillium taxi]|uniref:Translation machinery-associated protein 46 n=1 Tax=Penicillium taxi TaxID=168475 RepID=UPI0025459152|nr:Translation machinery-associated protein 46 [Penicillium taxi]KAJ5893672.1 Translation machinery-associated protein 46 [Penicillium taxi]